MGRGSPVCHLLGVTQAGTWTTLSLSFHICEMGQAEAYCVGCCGRNGTILDNWTGAGLVVGECCVWEVAANHETWNVVLVMRSGVGTKIHKTGWRGDGPAGRSLTMGLSGSGGRAGRNVNSIHCPWTCRVTHS